MSAHAMTPEEIAHRCYCAGRTHSNMPLCPEAVRAAISAARDEGGRRRSREALQILETGANIHPAARLAKLGVFLHASLDAAPAPTDGEAAE